MAAVGRQTMTFDVVLVTLGQNPASQSLFFWSWFGDLWSEERDRPVVVLARASVGWMAVVRPGRTEILANERRRETEDLERFDMGMEDSLAWAPSPADFGIPPTSADEEEPEGAEEEAAEEDVDDCVSEGSS